MMQPLRLPPSLPNTWNAAALVGQTSRSARVLQDPLFGPTWTSAAGLVESCPTE
jgi:hypothetical protein